MGYYQNEIFARVYYREANLILRIFVRLGRFELSNITLKSGRHTIPPSLVSDHFHWPSFVWRRLGHYHSEIGLAELRV